MPIAASFPASAASAALHLATASAPPCASSGFWLELAKILAPVFVALVIGLIAAGIAWHQAKIASAKLKLDLFERRLKLYIELRDFLVYATAESLDSHDMSRIAQMQLAATSAHFLFGADLGRDFDNAISKAIALRQAMRALRATELDDPGRAGAEATATALLDWFASQLEGLRSRFRKYMDFERWH